MVITDSDCIVSIDDIAKELAKELESMSPTVPHGTIHKVPEVLVKGNNDDYTPRLVSIGPYHSQNPNLAETNKLIKMQFLQNLISRSPQSNTLDNYSSAVSRIAEDAIGKYSSVDRKNISDERLKELATMMVVDGCFIIELFLERLPGDGHPRAVWPNISRKQLAFLHTDVLLVGNQIPFSVLEELFNASHIPNLGSLLKDVRKGNSVSPFTFTQLALAYFEQDELIGASAKKFYTRDENMSFQFDHLFHLYHSIWDPSFKVLGQSPEAQRQPTSTGCCPVCLLLCLCCWAVVLYWSVTKIYWLVTKIWELLTKLVSGLFCVLHVAVSFIISHRDCNDLQSIEQPSLDARLEVQNARLLHDMGIKFKKNTNAQNWLDISLTKGVLKIPALPIHQRTIIIFRNMVAFEELDSQSWKKNFTAFAKFMDTLIDSEKDVAILRKCGIIQSELDTDQEVADFFNNLCNVTDLDRGGHRHDLVELFKKLDRYYEDHRYEVMLHHWRMTLIPNSLRSAWAIPAIILGLIIVLPSILQTINTIYSMINHPQHPQQLISVY